MTEDPSKIRRVMPSIIEYDIKGVAPMVGPTGLIPEQYSVIETIDESGRLHKTQGPPIWDGPGLKPPFTGPSSEVFAMRRKGLEMSANTTPIMTANSGSYPFKPNPFMENPMNDLEAAVFYGIRYAQELSHKTSLDAGWYDDLNTGEKRTRNFGEVIALMHSELSEALEADRKDLMDDKLPDRKGVEVELADCLIRIFDTAQALKLDLAGALIEKNRYNITRADHKLENRKAGGKKY